jgi:hypothetical protein
MSKPITVISDKRFKKGNVKRIGKVLRGNPETVEMKPMTVPDGWMGAPPIVVSEELGKKIKEAL